METRAGNQLEEVSLPTYCSRRLLNRFPKKWKINPSPIHVRSRFLHSSCQYGNGNMFLEVLELIFGLLSELLEGGLGQYSES